MRSSNEKHQRSVHEKKMQSMRSTREEFLPGHASSQMVNNVPKYN